MKIKVSPSDNRSKMAVASSMMHFSERGEIFFSGVPDLTDHRRMMESRDLYKCFALSAEDVSACVSLDNSRLDICLVEGKEAHDLKITLGGDERHKYRHLSIDKGFYRDGVLELYISPEKNMKPIFHISLSRKSGSWQKTIAKCDSLPIHKSELCSAAFIKKSNSVFSHESKGAQVFPPVRNYFKEHNYRYPPDRVKTVHVDDSGFQFVTESFDLSRCVNTRSGSPLY